MLTIYKRHRKKCPCRGSPEIRVYLDGDLFLRKGKRNCSCTISVDGTCQGREIRKSLGTADWQKAQDKARDMEVSQSEPKRTQGPMTVENSWDVFLADLEARNLKNSTIRKYKLLKRQMLAFAANKGIRVLSEIDMSVASQFRNSWKDGPRSSGKKLERLRAFFRFAQQIGWLQKNPVAALKAPKVALSPTLPFSREEILRMLGAIERYKEEFPVRGTENAQRLRALVLLLRYTGMRIGDAITLSTDRIADNRLFLYTQKTGVPVNTVLPDFVIRALEQTPKLSGGRFFWNGEDQLEAIIGSWRRRLTKLFELAEVPNAHPHRLRDTFAVELLLSGVPIERVSILLGHHSVRTTERHYSPWIRARQEQLEHDLQRAWEGDPVLLAQEQGTRGVHGEKWKN